MCLPWTVLAEKLDDLLQACEQNHFVEIESILVNLVSGYVPDKRG